MINTIQLELGDRSYPIYLGAGYLNKAGLLLGHLQAKQIIIVTNETIAPLYLQQVTRHLQQLQVEVVILPDGEQYKTLTAIETIVAALLKRQFSRNATLIALGGGVIGDIGGFAAACYQRGIAYIQIPTTLLAQVDSSVGGKTGVNHVLGKNMLGAFHQPQCVIIDVNVLRTLDNRQLLAGIAEVIKYGLIRDRDFFNWIEANIDKILARDEGVLTDAIEQSCRNKAEIVMADERESGIRAILNLGHTFGHAIETGTGYRGDYIHGEAVAIGICQAADLSRRIGWLNDADVTRIETLFSKVGLVTEPPSSLSAKQYINLMAVDKKNIDGEIRLILLKKIGEASLPVSVERSALLATLNHYGRMQ